jgi:hypothetical protein
MKSNQIKINTGTNPKKDFFFQELDHLIINKQQEHFFDDGEVFFNLQNQESNLHNSLDLQNNNKSHGSSIKTNATFGEITQKGSNNVSFFSFNDEQNQNINIIQKKKELTKESIDVLNNFISKEKEKLTFFNINSINTMNNNNNNNNNIIENNLINLIGTNTIKDIKSNLFAIENKISVYFKKPYMRKNVIKNKKSIMKNYYEEQNEEDEKITFDDIKMKELKDDDSKTNNDSFEDMNTISEKKKSQ